MKTYILTFNLKDAEFKRFLLEKYNVFDVKKSGT